MNKDKSKKGTSEDSKEDSTVVSLTEYRKDRNNKQLRENERVLFNRILGVYSFVEKSGLAHVEVVDISFSGLRFAESHVDHPFDINERVALRFYFTPSSYLRVIVKVERRSRYQKETKEGIEYGCTFEKDTRSYEVLQDLIKFMHKYTETAVQDEDPPLIWF